uniref:Methionine synthase vitamin-B12 independent (MetE) n=1 Tax=uncultured marine group II/III euryarchaeote KM3_149_A03 TaxID=1457884 RepID=A0A075GIV9_9EURY|nr:methionine synthase vitamin-B12 independent (metE) [uncultured marine group II/III euryarchaeote KM3_149_A03]
MSQLPLFPSSIIGSMPRPAFVRRLIADDWEGNEQEYRQRMEAAVRFVVALQEEAGLDVVSDGEWWRKSYIGVIAELANGFELSLNPADGRPWTIVVDRLSPRQPGFIAREVELLKTLTDRAIKITLPAPALLGERMWDAEKSAAAYPTREDFVRDAVPILRRELELLRTSGATIVQVDDPHLCLFVDPAVRQGYENPDQAADFAVDMNNQLIDGVDDVTVAVHLCRRAGARARGDANHQGGFETIMPQLQRLRAKHVTMEFTTAGAGEMSVLRELGEDVDVGLGCVSCQPGQVDSVETIVERVEMALEFLDPSRITLNPDCGFAPGSAAEVSLDEVFQKLVNEVEAARQLREKYS